MQSEIPADVLAAALKVHADILGTNGCCDGVPEAVAYAFRAGRESAYTTDEWRAVFDAVDGPRAWHEPVKDRAIAVAILADCRKYYADAYLQHRRMGATDWELWNV